MMAVLKRLVIFKASMLILGDVQIVMLLQWMALMVVVMI